MDSTEESVQGTTSELTFTDLSILSNLLTNALLSPQRMGQSQYNPIYDFSYHLHDGRQAQMSVTSVAGHIVNWDIDEKYGWGKCVPTALFFDAPLTKIVDKVRTKRAQSISRVS
jgi:hypothetical protein